MSRTETYGTRSIAWSLFHRSMPPPAYMIDMDYLECCRYCKETLLIGELAKDVGQSFKPTTILMNLAKKARLPGILIFYDEELILSICEDVFGNSIKCSCCGAGIIPTFTKLELNYLWDKLSLYTEAIFRARQIYPRPFKDTIFTVKEYYDFIKLIHERHELICSKAKVMIPILVAGGS